MGYLDDLRTSQKKVTDLLANQEVGIEPGLARTKDLVLSGRNKYASNVNDVLSGVSSQYGISPDIVTAGQSTVRSVAPKLDRQLGETLDRSRMERKSRIYNIIFNTAFDNFVNAGMDLQTANARARQTALEKSNQDFEAGQAQKARDVALKKQDILDQYGSLYSGMDTSDPYEQAVIAALVGTGARFGTAGALGMFSKPSAPTSIPFTNPATTGYNPGSLRAKSMFGYRP